MINPFLTYAKNPDMPDTALGSMDTEVNKHGSCHDSLARRTILILSMGALNIHTYIHHTHTHTHTHMHSSLQPPEKPNLSIYRGMASVPGPRKTKEIPRNFYLNSYYQKDKK